MLTPSDRLCHSSWTDHVTALGQISVTALNRSVLQLRVTALFYLENKGKYIPEAWGHANPKDAKRRERERAWERDPQPFGSSFYMFFPPLGLPCVNWASQSAVCSTWGPHSGPQTFLCSIFVGFSLCLLATAILDSFFLFYLPNIYIDMILKLYVFYWNNMSFCLLFIYYKQYMFIYEK